MFVGYVTAQSVAASQPFLFETKYISNNSIAYDEATGTVTFSAPGWYKVEFTASASANGTYAPYLLVNDEALEYTSVPATATSTTSAATAITTVLRIDPSVLPNKVKMQVLNGGAATAADAIANLVITRIG